MHNIRRRLSIILFICSAAAILLTSLFVNITVNNKFNSYMVDLQNKRYERIVDYFQEVYKREGKWSKSSGVEMTHEAYMNNYCLSLLDINKKIIWGMDPNDIQERIHMNNMLTQNRGVYNSKTFAIKSKDKIVGYVNIGQYSSVLLSEDDLNFKTSINTSIIASVIVSFIIIILISLFFSRQFSNPIKEIANMSVDLSRGRFNARSVTESNILELEDLRISINTLAEKLNQQDKLRRRLVSDISHEIRTPLNVLQNNIEAMVDGIVPATNERLILLNDEVIRFGKLLDNLNALKEFEDENMALKIEPVDIYEIIKNVCEDFKVYLEEKNIILQLNTDMKDYVILGDKYKLKQVFINLLSNAIKFTPSNGRIWIDIIENNSRVKVSFKDNGIGINKADIPFIFERLYRGDKSRHEIEGSGIGLTIVRKILQLHSATIDVESEEGKGTIFKICFKK